MVLSSRTRFHVANSFLILVKTLLSEFLRSSSALFTPSRASLSWRIFCRAKESHQVMRLKKNVTKIYGGQHVNLFRFLL